MGRSMSTTTTDKSTNEICRSDRRSNLPLYLKDYELHFEESKLYLINYLMLRQFAKHTSKICTRNLYVQTENTPNPNSVKFLPGKPVLTSGTIEFRDKSEAKKSNFVSRLFFVDGVKSVMLGSDFVTITKQNEVDWALMRPEIFSIFMDFFAKHNSESIISEKQDKNDKNERNLSPENADIVRRITELLDNRIRPMIQRDGGDVQFIDFSNGVVSLEMKGACVGCPSSTVTLKHGIENMIKYYIPEVSEVNQVSNKVEKHADNEFEKFEFKLKQKPKFEK
ncbi:hypothetical protein GJ496_003945 [Pomphorhynchus laevis]|nr:hypothetical protein GJ496_003945 [Pomphorhynchus laevis]